MAKRLTILLGTLLFKFCLCFSQDYYTVEIEDEPSGFEWFNHFDEVKNKLIIGQTNEVLVIDSNQNVNIVDYSFSLLGPKYSYNNDNFFLAGYSTDFESKILIKTDENFDTINTAITPSRLDSTLYFGYNFLEKVGNKIVEIATLQDRSFSSGDLVWVPEWTVYNFNLERQFDLQVPGNREVIALNVKYKNGTLYILYKEIIKSQSNKSVHGLLKYDSLFNFVEDIHLYDSGRLGYDVLEFDILDEGKIIHEKLSSIRNKLSLHNSNGILIWEKEIKGWYYTDLPNIKGLNLLDDGIILNGDMIQNSTGRKRRKPNVFNTGWLAKVDFNGDIIWQHYYASLKEGNVYLNSLLRSVSILQDGSILSSGHVEHREVENSKKTWLLKLSPEGCLNSSYCDYDIHLKDSAQLVDTCELLFENPVWHYLENNPDCSLKIRVEVIGDTLINFQLASILGVFRQDTFITGSEIILSKEVGRLHFYEDDKWWMAYDYSTGINYGDTLEYFVPRNASFFTPNVKDNSAPINYRGPYYAYVDGSGNGSYSHDDSTFINKYFLLDVTSEFVEVTFIERSLEHFWDYVGPEWSLFGRFIGGVHENVCHANLICFLSNRIEQEFVDDGCNLATTVSTPTPFTKLKIYPNPTNNQIIIENSRSLYFKLISSTGIEVKIVQDNVIDIRSLPKGLYLVQGFDKRNNLLEFGKVVVY